MTKFDIDSGAIKKLASILNKEDLSMIEIKRGDDYIIVTRDKYNNIPVPVGTAPVGTVPVQANESIQVKPVVSDIEKNSIKSPIVGTVYLAPNPTADNFVKVGDKVKKGDTVIIIEAMKVMNTIQALKDCIIKEILVSDSQPVEFNQPLIVIE